MTWPLACWRLCRAVVHALHGVAIVLLEFPRAGPDQRHRRIAWWSARMLSCLGVRLEVQGQPAAGGVLIVANHVSWMDIMAVHAVCPRARFVSKADVQHWPVVRHLVNGARTLYLQRERPRDALRVAHDMARALSDGDAVVVFPEGTTGTGRALLPFHANLLQAAIAAGSPVQPVALRYADRHHAISPAAEFVGDTTLAQSLWRIACGRGLRVQVSLLAPRASSQADRRALSELVRNDIALALGEGSAPPTH